MSERWITIPNWDRFQHYSDRDPVWIKLYTELNRRDDWRQLTLAERGLIVSLWIEFAASQGMLRVSDLPGRLAQKNLRHALDSLREAGFIEVSASKPLALTRSREKEKSKTPPTPPQSGGANNRKRGPRKTGWRLVRGSHGQTHIPDPNGTDPPPVDAPSLKEMT